jgi:hypothetical protein
MMMFISTGLPDPLPMMQLSAPVMHHGNSVTADAGAANVNALRPTAASATAMRLIIDAILSVVDGIMSRMLALDQEF